MSPHAAASPAWVAAAVLRDAAGRILLAQRTRGEYAGRWEFPGGKCEPGESAQDALRRELWEELGIRAGALRPLITLPQHGARGPWCLDTWEVSDHVGTPEGREGQALAWVTTAQLRDYPMPPADIPVAAVLRDPPLYRITPDLAPDAAGELERGLERLCGTSPARLQWRLPQWDVAASLALLRRWLPRLRAAGHEVLLNGEPEQARQLGCGLHLRAALLPRLRVAALDGLVVTASCHDAGQLRLAAELGVQGVLLGPVLPTRTHPEAVPLGWDGFARLRAGSALPIYALGGLAAADLDTARRHGAQGIAAIRGLWP